MPRGTRGPVDGLGQAAPADPAASARPRRALNDLSNTESIDTGKGTSKATTGTTVRRSGRLSNESSQGSNPATETKASPRRQSLRSSTLSQSKSTEDAILKAEAVGGNTRKRTSRSSVDEDAKKAAAEKKSSTRAKRSRKVQKPETESFRKPLCRTRRRTESTSLNEPTSPESIIPAVSSVGSNPCPDVLTNSDHGLQRHPFSTNTYTSGIAAYDTANENDPLEVPKYVTDIFQRLFNAEQSTRPTPYMERQPELNGMMRAILIDWIVEVHMKFRLLPDTLYLCVNIIDRYLSEVSVQRNQLQLVGVTALLIACKYEEIYPPEVKDCVYITDRAYTRQDVLDMEAHIVKTLKFTLTVPTGHPFLQRFLHIVKATTVVRNLANYYMERTLQEHSSLMFKPSLLAAATVSLALNNPDRLVHDDMETYPPPKVPQSILNYSGFDLDEIKEAAVLVETKVGEKGSAQGRRQLIAVKRKYESNRYDAVSVKFQIPKASHFCVP